MSQFFDQASLVMVPSGYKDGGKVYSQKPLSTDGELTFTRATSATRVGPDGLFEKVRTNEVLYSEDLTNAAWGNFSITVGANATTAPNGTTTADKLTPTTSNTNHLIHSNVITSAGEYSFSVYVKAAGYSKVGLRESQSVGFFATFDLTSGTILDSSTSQTNTITSVGDGWYRITSTRSYSGGINLGLIPLEDSYTSGQPLAAYAGDGTSGIFAWGAQMEFNVPTDYVGPTTSAAVSVGPVANLLRLDYLGSSCPRLLLEPQRTNVLTYSEQIDNAAWTKFGSTITANSTTSPDGYTNADKVVEDTSTGAHGSYNVASVTTATAYTWSGFFKASERTKVRIIAQTADTPTAIYNLSNGTVESTSGSITASIVSFGNGWYRCIATTTSSGTTGFFNWSMLDASGDVTYTGDGTSGLFAWGCSIEAGAEASSYINTLGAAVTRGADFANKGGISSLFGATEGTFFCELTYTNINSIPIFLQSSVSSSFNQASYLQMGGNKVTYNVYSGGSQQVGITSTSNFTEGQNLKIAIVYKANDFVIYINGVSEGAVSSGSISNSLTAIQIGRWDDAGSTFQYFGRISQAILFPTRLSNADLATLTTI